MISAKERDLQEESHVRTQGLGRWYQDTLASVGPVLRRACRGNSRVHHGRNVTPSSRVTLGQNRGMMGCYTQFVVACFQKSNRSMAAGGMASFSDRFQSGYDRM